MGADVAPIAADQREHGDCRPRQMVVGHQLDRRCGPEQTE